MPYAIPKSIELARDQMQRATSELEKVLKSESDFSDRDRAFLLIHAKSLTAALAVLNLAAKHAMGETLNDGDIAKIAGDVPPLSGLDAIATHMAKLAQKPENQERLAGVHPLVSQACESTAHVMFTHDVRAVMKGVETHNRTQRNA